MKRYLIVLEGTGTGYSAYSPDLPGCIATRATETEVKRKMREAIEFHVTGLREQGEPVPEPRSGSRFCKPKWTGSDPEGSTTTERGQDENRTDHGVETLHLDSRYNHSMGVRAAKPD